MTIRKRGPRGLLIALLYGAIFFGAGFLTGHATAPANAAAQVSGDPLRPLLRIWDLLHSEYYRQPLDEPALIQGAIDGMLATLDDKHTSYMPPGEFEALSESLQGEFEGIGAEVDNVDGRLTIVSPIEGSPAEAAGLKAGDVIVTVDGQVLSERFEDPLGAIVLVRGPSGSPVTLGIEREGQRFDVTIVRARIPLVSVRGRMLEEAPGIAYVNVSSFADNTMPELQTKLTELMAAQPTGMILDLRGNPGGGLMTAIQVTSQFIGSGVVMVEEWGSADQERFEAYPDGLATEIPLVVLIDEGSASASEIVAGAIQDRERGLLIGAQSYGKGTVQNWHPLEEGDGGVRITIARWLTPNGRWIHQRGLTPDIKITHSEADQEADRDRQLEAAIKSLQGERVQSDPEPWERYWR